ncbi:MAG: SDR family oxidoreductase [Candidatus Glassbacteria bacterium]|nr:SDR family oxidoreductase [Candidatus Glassbacteria bacterium]
MNQLSGKVAVVTGGGTGIGKAIAARFVAEGAQVVICGRRVDKLEQAAAEIAGGGDNPLALQCDVTDQAQILGLAKTVTNRFEGIDVLVNNAGVMRFDELAVATDQQYELMMKTNVWAPWRCGTAVIPHMIKRGGGSIITISSVAGLRPLPGAGLYCTSKAAVQMLTQTMALEHAADQIRVNVICPAVVEGTELPVPIVGEDGVADFYNKLRVCHPLGRNGRPEDIAETALYLASDASRWVTGVILPVDGGRMLTSNRPKIT